MRLSHLRISNHARVPDVDLEVGEHLVLVGPNGCGKSSLLRSLSLMTSGLAAELYEYFTVDVLRDPSRPLEMDVVMTALDPEEQETFAEEIDLDPDTGRPRLCFHMQVAAAETGPDPETVLIQRTFPQAGKNGSGGDPTRPPRRRQLRAMGVHYLPAHRLADAVAIDGSLCEIAGAQPIDPATLQNLSEHLTDFDSGLNTDPVMKALRHRIARHITAAMPGVLREGDVRVSGAGDPRRPFGALRLQLRGATGLHFPASDHSDGMRQMLAISLHDLAHASASTVVIDEPEVHLHPTSQRAAARMLRSKPGRGGDKQGTQNQKIIATHSPFIVHAFEPRHVVAMMKDRCTRTDPDERYSRQQKVAAHWWSPQLLEALTANRVVFVEGIADRLVILAAAGAWGVDLLEQGVLVFELRGASNFTAVHRLLGPSGFDLTWSGLVDTDYAQRWRDTTRLGPGAADELVQVCEPDLEGEYCRALGAQRVCEALRQAEVVAPARLAAAVHDPESGEPDQKRVEAWCRENKVDAALAVCEALTWADVPRMPGVWRLLTRLDLDDLPGPAS